MTPEERAEKIDKKIYAHTFDSGEERIVWIAAQIREAEEEAQKGLECSHCSGVLQTYQMKFYRGCLCRCHESTYAEAYKQGRASMREEAAKVAEKEECDPYTGEACNHIAKLIRAITVEEKCD